MILNIIGDLLTDGCQVEEFLLYEGVFDLFGALMVYVQRTKPQRGGQLA